MRQRYDSFGRLLAVEYPDGEVVNYKYGNGGQVKEVSGTMPYIETALYDVYGKPLVTIYGNGIQVINRYEGNQTGEPFTQRLKNQLMCPKWNTNCSIIDDEVRRIITYEYDKVGNIVGTDENRSATDSNIIQANRAYCYDSLHRLTTVNSTFTLKPGTLSHN